MIRGAIDNIHPQRIGGWIYSASESLRGMTVLAFLDGACVGSGLIELYRKDLADAGLGDGYVGFSFPISVPEPDGAMRTVVRIDGSDLVLLPRTANISSYDRSNSFDGVVHTPKSVEWMRSQGWLDTLSFNFLKCLTQVGVFDYSLRRLKNQSEVTKPNLEAEPIAAEYFRLLSLSDVTTQHNRLTVSSRKDILKFVEQQSKLSIPYAGIVADRNSSIQVMEGSHLDRLISEKLDGAISYSIGPDRILFINLLCNFELLPSEHPIGVALFSGSRA